MSLIIVKGVEIDSKKDKINDVILIVNGDELRKMDSSGNECKISFRGEPSRTFNDVELLYVTNGDKTIEVISNDNKSNSEVV